MQKKGLPATIHRPGFIMGDGVRGKVNHTDFMSRFYRSCLQLKARPALPNQTKAVVTVDFASKAIIHIASNAANYGHAFHIVPHIREEDSDLETIWSTLEDIGYPCPQVSYRDWIELMCTGTDMLDNPLFSLLPTLQEVVYKGRTRWELYENMAEYDVSNSRRALANMDYRHKSGLNHEFLVNYMRELMMKGSRTK